MSKTKSWVPEDWRRSHQDYARAGAASRQRSGNLPSTAHLQAERFRRRREQDEAYWQELEGSK